MQVFKNQIRPRRKKFHFTNAEILNLDTLGLVQLVPPVLIGQPVMATRVQIRTNIVAPYTNITSADIPILLFTDDFTIADAVDLEDDGAAVTVFSDLFTVMGLNLLTSVCPQNTVDAFTHVVPYQVTNWTDEADLFSNGGLSMFFYNGGDGDLTGGNSANYLDIFIDYKIINLDINQ